MPLSDNPPSCCTCLHAQAYSHPSTLEDPAEEGWECAQQDKPAVANLIETYSHLPHAEAAIASNCVLYQLDTSKLEGDSVPDDLFPSAEELELYRRVDAEMQATRLQEMGLLDETGQPTHAFYALSDQQYDEGR